MNNRIPKFMINKLIKAANYDLQIRQELIEKGELSGEYYHPVMKKVHEDNLKLLQDFLSEYGWPIPLLHGKEAFEAAWLISIHAIEHPAQMIKARDEIKNMLTSGEPVADEYGRLYDRIALYSGGKQRYGTQFWPSKNGWHLKNLKSETKAEKFRAEIGMQSLRERWEEMKDYKDESGFIDNEEEQNRQFNEWYIKTGWRDLNLLNN